MHNERWMFSLPGGMVAITALPVPDGHPDAERFLAKTLFHMSRLDPKTNDAFDDAVHGRASLSAGIPGHIPLEAFSVQVGEIPSDKSNRQNWRIDNGKLVT